MTRPVQAIADRFDATHAAEYGPRYNIAPQEELAVITGEDPERITTATWGLIPRGGDRSDALINARIETVTETPAFRDAYRRRRCLVIVDGFYEWVDTDDGKRPYRVCRTDGEPFAVAGIWESWQPTTTQTALSAYGEGRQPTDAPAEERRVAILTTEPNDLIAPLHHRMAVIVPGGRQQDYLDGTIDREVLATPHPTDGFEAYPVTTTVNDPTTSGPSLIEPVGSRRG